MRKGERRWWQVDGGGGGGGGGGGSDGVENRQRRRRSSASASTEIVETRGVCTRPRAPVPRVPDESRGHGFGASSRELVGTRRPAYRAPRGAEIRAAAANQSPAHNPPSVNILCHRVRGERGIAGMRSAGRVPLATHQSSPTKRNAPISFPHVFVYLKTSNARAFSLLVVSRVSRLLRFVRIDETMTSYSVTLRFHDQKFFNFFEYNIWIFWNFVFSFSLRNENSENSV